MFFIILIIPLIVIVVFPAIYMKNKWFLLYIHFNENSFEYKFSYLRKPIVVEFSEIEFIDINYSEILVQTSSNFYKIQNNKQDFVKRKHIKSTFEEIKNKYQIKDR